MLRHLISATLENRQLLLLLFVRSAIAGEVNSFLFLKEENEHASHQDDASYHCIAEVKGKCGDFSCHKIPSTLADRAQACCYGLETSHNIFWHRFLHVCSVQHIENPKHEARCKRKK